MILESAVGFDFIVQDIDVPSEFKKCVVTLLVMSRFLNSLGASRACDRNRDLTAESRMMLIGNKKNTLNKVFFLFVLQVGGVKALGNEQGMVFVLHRYQLPL